MAAVLARQPTDGNTYSFASQPRAVPNRKKYREELNRQDTDEVPRHGNIMYDRRVIRGNTYSQHVLPALAQPDPIELQRQQEVRRRALARKRAKDQLRPKSPDAVEGRKHIDIQTELYLEELADRIEEADVQCQTDAFMDRPASPLFVPAKSGEDKETQILNNELFDFNLEVKPILEVLVGKTIEQSLLEVCSEEELARLRQQQRAFEELRHAELVEAQRLEEQDRRHREEKDRRLRQQRELQEKEQETATKIAAHAFAQSYLADLVPSVFGTLAENGYFYDPVERDVESGFLPWLMDEVSEQLSISQRARTLLDGMLRDIVRDRHNSYRELQLEILKKQQQEEAQRLAAQQELQRQEEERQKGEEQQRKLQQQQQPSVEAVVEVKAPTPTIDGDEAGGEADTENDGEADAEQLDADDAE